MLMRPDKIIIHVISFVFMAALGREITGAGMKLCPPPEQLGRRKHQRFQQINMYLCRTRTKNTGISKTLWPRWDEWETITLPGARWSKMPWNLGNSECFVKPVLIECLLLIFHLQVTGFEIQSSCCEVGTRPLFASREV